MNNAVFKGPNIMPCGHWALLAAFMFTNCEQVRPGNAVDCVDRPPALFPYAQGTTIPPNIAPLNFIINEKGERFFVSISKRNGPGIEITSRKPAIIIPPKKWRDLLGAASGQPIGITVSCRSNGAWRRYETIWDTVAVNEIDRYLVYRRIPVCKDWTFMGFYQRDLHTCSEQLIFHSYENGACFHCHSFRGNDAGNMVLEFRSKTIGAPMLLGTTDNSKVVLRAINTKTPFSTGKVGFTSWHPQESIIAFSMNKFQMVFNSAGSEPREVFDAEGDIALFDFRRNTVISCPEISQKDRIETTPEWSIDGRFLYFCSAPQLPESRFREIRCDLLRMGFDPGTSRWGKLDTVITAETAGASLLQPKCSPDGAFILVTIAPYGDFPIDKIHSRLALIDAKTSALHILDFGSRWSDGWHSWSGNGHWIVFTSKRMNGRFTSPWFSFMDDAGVVHAPFVLPQVDPAYFESSIIGYTMPEFTTGKILFTSDQIRKVIDSYSKNAPSNAAAADSAWSAGEKEF